MKIRRFRPQPSIARERELIHCRDTDSVNDRINAFEKRTTISVKSTTRLTNANEPLHVDRKVWSSSYEPNTNGMPQTDPEVSLSAVEH